MHYSELQSQTFLRADLENALRAIKRTNDALASNSSDPKVKMYTLGFDAALLAMATFLNVRLDPFEAVHNRVGMGTVVPREPRDPWRG
jgi:hypothetical protein